MYHRHRHEQSNTGLLAKFAGLTVVIGIIALIFRAGDSRRSRALVSGIPDEVSQPALALPNLFAKKKSPEDLRTAIRQRVNNRMNNYSVYIHSLNTPFTMGINETVIFTAASLNKVPIIAALYYLAGKVEIDLDERVTIQPGDVQNFGTGSIRYDPPRSVYSLKTLAKLAIEQSDNTAAYVLGNYTVGIDKTQSLVNAWGLTQTDIVNNKTSNLDIARLFEKIYNGDLTSPSSTKELLAYFKDTDFEDRLPALLPKTVSVYHKIGNEIAVLHDAGIVTDSKTTYYIGVFTNDITDEKETEKIIAEISKLTYDYLK